VEAVEVYSRYYPGISTEKLRKDEETPQSGFEPGTSRIKAQSVTATII
jgi:hypothetical protein